MSKKKKRVLPEDAKVLLRKYLRVDAELTPEENVTLSQLRARAFVKLCVIAGHDRCEVCRNPTTTYDRKLHAAMVATLVAWWGVWGDYAWHSLNDLYKLKSNLTTVRGGDFAKLIYWGFIEERPKTDENKKNTGIYRITEDGVAFVLGKTRFSRSAYVYNDHVMGWSEELVNVYEALGDTFDYNELMGFKDTKVVQFKAI